jgi:glucose/arabinose dehydrogenase
VISKRQICTGAIALALAVGGGSSLRAQDVLPPIPQGDITIRLLPLVTGMGAPDYATSAPGNPDRLYVVEQKGLLQVVDQGSLLATPALDIQSLIGNTFNPASANDERGFLGVAFHPGFNTPSSPGFQTLYTYSSQPLATGPAPTYPVIPGGTQNFKNVINEWKLSGANPNVVDPGSRREIMSFGKQANNHNGGTIAFGPDGYLYLATGDGGNANDVGPSHIEPGGNAQNLGNALGKMLRIDPLDPSLTPGSPDAVSGSGAYRIPQGNPFDAAGQVPEIFAYGFRNPYRFAFDDRPGGTGDLILADVGQNAVEEINRVTLGGNYGWAVKEGTFLFNRVNGPGGNAGTVGANSPGVPTNMIDPISGTLGTLQYDHGDGISITGGFVYRGSAIPELLGKYVFGDLAIRVVQGQGRVDGRLFYADLVTGLINEFQLPQFANDQIPNGLTVHGFGQDGHGELYALVTNTPANGTGGILYKIVAVPEPSAILLLLVEAGIFWTVGAPWK